ncbi:MAG TPA: histidine kinase, partial [Chitinophagaceae bacterium]
TYLLSVYYRLQPENAVLYKIVIAPAWYQTSGFKWIIGSGICLLLLIFSYLFYSYKIRRQKQEQARIDLELKSIRSQLNPHFIFNALSSIQGLINNDEIDKANIYLSEFGSLMRDTLSGNNINNNTLSAEMKILDRYLQLEQLRFGFKFLINANSNINTSETEIPSLLLQPIVENAVKHGVSPLREKGMIDIGFEKQAGDLVIKIKDNGKGFSQNSNNGYGIKLTKDRIQLLNQVNKEQPISFDISSGDSGTTVLLSFKNWF